MKQGYILAVDLGTGGLKTVLFDFQLQMVANAFHGYATSYPQRDWAEQNPDDWWHALRITLQKILTRTGIDPSEIAMIGIASMTPVLVPVNSAGEAVRAAILWMDRRAQQESCHIAEVLGDSHESICGNHNDPSNFTPKAMWFRTHEPEAYQRTAVLHHANGYLIHRMTAVHVLDKTQCGLSQLCDLSKSDWSEPLIAASGLDKEKLPPIYESTAIVGTVTVQAARELGIAADTPVIAGAMDNVAAGLGLGVARSGEIYVSAGTATNVCVCSDQVPKNPRVHNYRHIVADTWLSVAGVDYGGAGYKWFKEILGDITFEELDAAIAQSYQDLSSPLLFLPYMLGQRAPLWNGNTRGVLFGLHPSMGRAQVARAFVEGNAMGVRRVLDILTESDSPSRSIRFTGGAIESSVCTQIFADVIGCTLEIVAERDATTFGIALTAAHALGLHNSFEDLGSKIPVIRRIKPRENMRSYYRDLQDLFTTLCQKLDSDFEQLAAIAARYGEGSALDEVND